MIDVRGLSEIIIIEKDDSVNKVLIGFSDLKDNDLLHNLWEIIINQYCHDNTGMDNIALEYQIKLGSNLIGVTDRCSKNSGKLKREKAKINLMLNLLTVATKLKMKRLVEQGKFENKSKEYYYYLKKLFAEKLKTIVGYDILEWKVVVYGMEKYVLWKDDIEEFAQDINFSNSEYKKLGGYGTLYINDMTPVSSNFTYKRNVNKKGYSSSIDNSFGRYVDDLKSILEEK